MWSNVNDRPAISEIIFKLKRHWLGMNIGRNVDEVVVIHSWTKFLFSECLSNILALLMMPDG